jgi:DNA polymerase I-like protein with 3'-5' exonuclease and polymerase domains
VPRLILMQVYDGQRAAVLRPDQVLMFIHEHKDREWVAHNARFDYWVLQKYLAEVAPLVVSSWATRVAQEQLQAIADQGRLHDTKILDFLLQLATQTRSEVIRPRSLKDLVYDYLGKDMPKDQYREDFTQIEGKNWQEVDRGFFDYAVRDAVGTFQVYQLLAGRARAEARKWSGRPTYPAAGLLTEALQVRADLALAQAGRTGLAIDRDYLAQLKHDLEAKIQALTDWFDDHSPALFHRYRVKHRRGELKLNKANGLPVTNYYVLRAQLIAIAAQLGLPEDSLPRSKKTGVVSTSLDYWRDQARGHEFVEQWVQLVDTAKMLQFVRIVERQPDGVARTDYQVLVRTGRTSAREPNIQNMPKEP